MLQKDHYRTFLQQNMSSHTTSVTDSLIFMSFVVTLQVVVEDIVVFGDENCTFRVIHGDLWQLLPFAVLTSG